MEGNLTLKSPRPVPQFFQDNQLSTKKARGVTPKDRVPPRPPVKGSQGVSRLFSHYHPAKEKALAVSFRSNDNSIVSKHYDENNDALYFEQGFTVISVLGTGSFGEVFKVRSKEDGRFYAVKKSRERFKGEFDRKLKLQEVLKHENLPRHDNCIRFFRAWEEDQRLYIQTELCETSLSNFAEQNHDIPERLVWKYLVDLLLATKHLHDHDLIHLDIKPDNIFISKSGICKLGDFGLVVDLTKNEISKAQEGDPKYLAKELMDGKYTKAADIFSLGITMLELACDLDLPRCDEAWHQLRRAEIPPAFTQHLSPELKEIISMMIRPDYKKRPSADEILNHPLMEEVLRWRKLELGFKSMLSKVSYATDYFTAFLTFIWMVFCWPVKLLCSRKGKDTPKSLTPQRKLSECEYSFSDDELDTGRYQRGDGSPPLHTDSSTTSGDSHNGSYTGNSYSRRPLNSTPTISRSRTSHSVRGSRNTSIAEDSPTRHSSFAYGFPPLFLPGGDDDELHLEPRNLKNVFASMGEDSDDNDDENIL